MSEGKKITVKQAESCMMADAGFIACGPILHYAVRDGRILANSKSNNLGEHGWVGGNCFHFEKDITIHADPNNTFERLFGSGELTFEEAWAAVGKGMIVHCTSDEFEWLIKLSDDKYNVHLVIRDWNCSWCTGWRNAEKGISKDWKYTLYKEPTPEPLTLEALEARVKALEERS